MATAKVEKIVTAAVIEALGTEAGGLAAELTAEVLNRKVPKDPYSSYRLFWDGGGGEEIPYLESLAREEMQRIAKEAVQAWFAERQADLRQRVIAHIDANQIADSFMGELGSIFERGGFSMSVNVEPVERVDD